MTEFAEWLFTGIGFAVVCAILLIGFVSGFILRWLSELPDRRIMIVSGLLPIFLFAIFVFLRSFGHGALGITDYANWRSLFEFLLMFCVSFVGAVVGVRAHQSLCRFLPPKRSEEGE
ncbi:MAG: hypothetical protein ABJ239_10620 [Erythrobacter sp.]